MSDDVHATAPSAAAAAGDGTSRPASSAPGPARADAQNAAQAAPAPKSAARKDPQTHKTSPSADHARKEAEGPDHDAAKDPAHPRASWPENAPPQTGSGAAAMADPSGTGSALASAKLSSKKKEALSQVPCKFFRSNGCSAGASCPFSHTLPGGSQKATCQWFLKGNCRFGHKCALAHIFPGQPISMDRKNKRAVQHGQPLPQTAAEAAAQSKASPARVAGPANPNLPDRPNVAPNVEKSDSGLAEATPVPSPRLPHARAEGGRNLPNGVGGKADTHRARPLPIRPNTEEWDEEKRWRPGDELFELQEEASSAMGGRSGAVPVPMPAGARGPTARRPESGSYSHSMLLGGVGSPGSAFGTSPFTNNAVFYSESQGQDEDPNLLSRSHPHPSGQIGSFAERRGSMRTAHGPGSLRSHRLDRMDDPLSLAMELDDMSVRSDALAVDPRHVRRNLLHEEDEAEEEEEDTDRHEEDFLPSSLSDLLTPEELERRARSSRNTAQSLPVNGGARRSHHGFPLSSSHHPKPLRLMPSTTVPSALAPGSLGAAGYDPPPTMSFPAPTYPRTSAAVGSSSGFAGGSALSLTRSKLDATPEERVLNHAPSVGLAPEPLNTALPANSTSVGLSRSANTLSVPTGTGGPAFSPELAPIAPGSVLPPRQFGFAAMLGASVPSGTSLEPGSVPRDVDASQTAGLSATGPARGQNEIGMGLAPPSQLTIPSGSSRPAPPSTLSPAGFGPVHGSHLLRPEEDDAIFELE